MSHSWNPTFSTLSHISVATVCASNRFIVQQRNVFLLIVNGGLQLEEGYTGSQDAHQTYSRFSRKSCDCHVTSVAQRGRNGTDSK